MLPKFVPIRIFALEYIRHMINMDQLHFVAANKKPQFKIKTQVGPFVCNARLAGKEEETLQRIQKYTKR